MLAGFAILCLLFLYSIILLDLYLVKQILGSFFRLRKFDSPYVGGGLEQKVYHEPNKTA